MKVLQTSGRHGVKPSSKNTSHSISERFSQPLPYNGPLPPDLAAVIEAWNQLPDPARHRRHGAGVTEMSGASHVRCGDAGGRRPTSGTGRFLAPADPRQGRGSPVSTPFASRGVSSNGPENWNNPMAKVKEAGSAARAGLNIDWRSGSAHSSPS